jgi:hypothetical protein
MLNKSDLDKKSDQFCHGSRQESATLLLKFFHSYGASDAAATLRTLT